MIANLWWSLLEVPEEAGGVAVSAAAPCTEEVMSEVCSIEVDKGSLDEESVKGEGEDELDVDTVEVGAEAELELSGSEEELEAVVEAGEEDVVVAKDEDGVAVAADTADASIDVT